MSLDSNNTRKYVSVNQLAENLGERLCKALPVFHIFTGSDYTASFSREGKVRPFNLLAEDVDVQDAFYALCNSSGTDINLSNAIEKFVCTMYGKKMFDHVDVGWKYDAAMFQSFSKENEENTLNCSTIELFSETACAQQLPF